VEQGEMAMYRDLSNTVQQDHADPLLERYSRAPYDPLYSAEIAGRATGEAIRDPSFRRWVRIIGFIAATAFLGTLVIAFAELIRFTS
jgi:hypothetical protein